MNKFGLTTQEMNELAVPKTTYLRRRERGWTHEEANDPNGRIVTRDCVICGEMFVVPANAHNKSTCSKKCGRVLQNGYAKKHDETLHYGDPEVSRMMRLWR